MNWRAPRGRYYSPPTTFSIPTATSDRLCLSPQEMESVHRVPRCQSHPNTIPLPQLVSMRPGRRFPGTVTIPNDFHHSYCDPAVTYFLSRNPESNYSQNLRPPDTFHPATQTANRPADLDSNAVQSNLPNINFSRNPLQHHSNVADPSIQSSQTPQFFSPENHATSRPILHSGPPEGSQESFYQPGANSSLHYRSVVEHPLAPMQRASPAPKRSSDTVMFHSDAISYRNTTPHHNPPQRRFNTGALRLRHRSQGDNAPPYQLLGQNCALTHFPRPSHPVGPMQQCASPAPNRPSETAMFHSDPISYRNTIPNYNPPRYQFNAGALGLRHCGQGDNTSSYQLLGQNCALSHFPRPAFPSAPMNQNVPTYAQAHHTALRRNEQIGSVHQQGACLHSPQIASQHFLPPAHNYSNQYQRLYPDPSPRHQLCDPVNPRPQQYRLQKQTATGYQPYGLHRFAGTQVSISAPQTSGFIHQQYSLQGEILHPFDLSGCEQDTSGFSAGDSSLVRQINVPQDAAFQVASNSPSGVSSGTSTGLMSPPHKIQRLQNPSNIPESLGDENTLSVCNNSNIQQQSSETGATNANFLNVAHGNANVSIADATINILSGSGVIGRTADQSENQAYDFNTDVTAENFYQGIHQLNVYNQPGSTSPTNSSIISQEKEQAFLEICKETTVKNTKHDVRSTFYSILSLPGKKINPVYLKTKYYRGDTDLESAEYRPDDMYEQHSKRGNKGKKVKISQLLDEGQYVALIGDAGAGKTTTAKRFAQLVISKKITSLRHIKLVLFIKFAELDSSRKYTAFDLIFAKALGAKLDPSLKKYGSKWVREHSKQILLVMDGLDQADWKLGDDMYLVAYDRPAKVSSIFFNILRRNLIPECKILITCREHAIEHCPREIWPDVTIALTGLEPKDRDYLILQMAGDKGDEIISHLSTRSPGLLSLCQTPMFLVFTTAVLVRDLENAPETMSGILFRFLVYFEFSENRRVTKKEAEFVFAKLKDLAFKGISEKRVIFKACELSECGLTVSQVQDLVLVVPQSGVPEFNVIVKEFQNIFFRHQLIQETFAAMYICEMALDDFKDFVWDNFDNSHFSVVRVIVLGILLNPNVDVGINKSILGNISEKSKKMEALKHWLETILNNRVKKKAERDKSILNLASADDVDFFKLLYECGDGIDDILKKHLHSTNVTSRVFKDDILHVVTSVMSRCSAISRAKFDKVTLSSGNVEKMVSALIPCASLEVNVLQLKEISEHEADRLLTALGDKKETICAVSEEQGAAIQPIVLVKTIDMRRQLRHLSINMICNLLPCVSECLDLRENKLNKRDESLLQMRLNQLYPTNLKVKVGLGEGRTVLAKETISHGFLEHPADYTMPTFWSQFTQSEDKTNVRSKVTSLGDENPDKDVYEVDDQESGSAKLKPATEQKEWISNPSAGELEIFSARLHAATTSAECLKLFWEIGQYDKQTMCSVLKDTKLINVSDLRLSLDDCDAIRRVIGTSTGPVAVNLRNCDLKANSLQSLMPPTSEIRELNVTENRNLTLVDLKYGMELCAKHRGIFEYDIKYLIKEDSEAFRKYINTSWKQKPQTSVKLRKNLKRENRVQSIFSSLMAKASVSPGSKLHERQHRILDFSSLPQTKPNVLPGSKLHKQHLETLNLSSFHKQQHGTLNLPSLPQPKTQSSFSPVSTIVEECEGVSEKQKKQLKQSVDMQSKEEGRKDLHSDIEESSKVEADKSSKSKKFKPRNLLEHVKYRPMQKYQEALAAATEGSFELRKTRRKFQKDRMIREMRSNQARYRTTAIKQRAYSRLQSHVVKTCREVSSIIGKSSNKDTGYRSWSHASDIHDKVSLRRFCPIPTEIDDGSISLHTTEASPKAIIGADEEECSIDSTKELLFTRAQEHWDPLEVEKQRFKMTCMGLGIMESKQSQVEKWLERAEFGKEPHPPPVEHIKTQRSNGVIKLIWDCFPEEPNMICGIQQFCNGEPVGEVHFKQDLYFELLSPLPSMLYCFQIWSEGSDGAKSEKVFSAAIATYPSPVKKLRLCLVNVENQDLETPKIWMGADVSVSESFSRHLGKDGGNITIVGCSITFPPGTFPVLTKIEGKVEIDRKQWPENYRGITPMLYVNAERDLEKPATVELTSWCTNDPAEKECGPVAYVLHYCEENSIWETITEAQITSQNTFQFKCQQFSPVLGAVPKSSTESNRRLDIDSSVYSSEKNEFYVALHLKNDLLHQKTVNEQRLHREISFNTIAAKASDTLKISLSCQRPEGFSFSVKEPLQFIIKEDFDWVHSQIVLRKEMASAPDQLLEIRSELQKNDEIIDNAHDFYYEWKNFLLGKRARNCEVTGQSAGECATEMSFHGEQRASTFMQGFNFNNFFYKCGNEHDSKSLKTSIKKQGACSKIRGLELTQKCTTLCASWDPLLNEGTVKYFVVLYCGGRKVNEEPFVTSSTSKMFRNIRVEPSTEYFCEVWARNMYDVDGGKIVSKEIIIPENFNGNKSEDPNEVQKQQNKILSDTIGAAAQSQSSHNIQSSKAQANDEQSL